jgi:hypothetical protein
VGESPERCRIVYNLALTAGKRSFGYQTIKALLKKLAKPSSAAAR